MHVEALVLTYVLVDLVRGRHLKRTTGGRTEWVPWARVKRKTYPIPNPDTYPLIL